MAEIAGVWAGTLSHAGETEPIALELEPGTDGKVLIRMSVPVAHLARAPIGSVAAQFQGNEVRLGPFVLQYDRAAKTLCGVAPKDLVPLYEIPLTLRRVERFDVPRAAGDRGARSPRRSGRSTPGRRCGPGRRSPTEPSTREGRTASFTRWTRAPDGRGGPSRREGRYGRGRRSPGADLYFQADDGYLYKLAAASGEERWRVRVVEKPIERLPFDNPKSRYDRFGSDVTVAGGRLYLGTHDGRVLVAIDPARGEKAWEFASGDSVLAAPAVEGDRVFFGSLRRPRLRPGGRHREAAVEARHARGRWSRRRPSSGDRVVVGNRSYDLLGLDARTRRARSGRATSGSRGSSRRPPCATASPTSARPTPRPSTRSTRGPGERRWKTDVYGWAWGQPAVTDARVYAGTASQKDYLAGHKGLVVAMDRATGRPAWHYVAEPAATGPYGFPGSPAVGDGLVFVTGLDGKVYAFTQ